MVTRFIKVKAHSGEPLNEAADAIASATAEADDNPMAGELYLEQDAVHFYIHDCPVEWDTCGYGTTWPAWLLVRLQPPCPYRKFYTTVQCKLSA